jgi:hypothetical protein
MQRQTGEPGEAPHAHNAGNCHSDESTHLASLAACYEDGDRQSENWNADEKIYQQALRRSSAGLVSHRGPHPTGEEPECRESEEDAKPDEQVEELLGEEHGRKDGWLRGVTPSSPSGYSLASYFMRVTSPPGRAGA